MWMTPTQHGVTAVGTMPMINAAATSANFQPQVQPVAEATYWLVHELPGDLQSLGRQCGRKHSNLQEAEQHSDQV